MKYKAGDKVRVRKDLRVGKLYDGSWVFINAMEKYMGEVVTIKEIGTDINDYYLLKGIPWRWTDEMLEPIKRGRPVGSKNKPESTYSPKRGWVLSAPLMLDFESNGKDGGASNGGGGGSGYREFTPKDEQEKLPSERLEEIYSKVFSENSGFGVRDSWLAIETLKIYLDEQYKAEKGDK